jgi:hypothetical protein
MKRAYTTPRLVNHGSVSEITEANFANKNTDYIFGTVLGNNPPPQGPGGSLDACVSKDIKKCEGANL